MSELPMMPWWPRDFLAATLGWTIVERGLYQALLDAQWELESLPSDEVELIAIARATTEEFKAGWPRVKTKFSTCTDGRLVNVKLEEHRGLAFKYRDKRRAAGRIGGRASAEKRASNRSSNRSSKRSTVGGATVQAKSKHPSPSTIAKKKVKKKKVLNMAEVDGLNLDAWKKWLAYRTATNKPVYTTNGQAIKLAKLPHDKQMECVTASIDQAYTGLFPDKFTGNGNAQNNGRTDNSFDAKRARLAKRAGLD